MSCKEKYQPVDPIKFNKKLALRTDINTAEKLMLAYYEMPQEESGQQIDVIVENLQNNIIKVTLIHDNQGDDSQKATKIVMETIRNKTQWTVLSIQKNWKCYPGRGHTQWGVAPCK